MYITNREIIRKTIQADKTKMKKVESPLIKKNRVYCDDFPLIQLTTSAIIDSMKKTGNRMKKTTEIEPNIKLSAPFLYHACLTPSYTFVQTVLAVPLHQYTVTVFPRRRGCHYPHGDDPGRCRNIRTCHSVCG